MNNLNRIIVLVFFISFFLFHSLFSFAADFIVPNSSGEPIVIDVSNLNLTSDITVAIGDFTDQPRPYRDSGTKSLVIFPPPFSSSEKTIQVLAGGSNLTKTISFRPSPSGVLKSSLLPKLNEARAGNTVTKISDGRIVLIGGSKEFVNNPIDSLEVFDPETGKSENLKTPNELKDAKLKRPRSQHTATYLGVSDTPFGMITGPVEQILIAGGFSKDGFIENSIEIVEIKIGTLQCKSTLLSQEKSKLKKARVFHTASLLPDGRVLIVGGQGKISMTELGALSSIEIFDPVTKSILPSDISLNSPRLLHTATTLQNGNILICGGFTNEKQNKFGFGPATNSAEIFDTKNLSLKKVGLLINNEGVGGHSATLLTNGFVLIIGGSSDFFSRVTEDVTRGLTRTTIQFFDQNSETFSAASSSSDIANLNLQISRFLHQTVLLPNGNVAVIGGLNIKASSTTTQAIISSPITSIEIFEIDSLNSSPNTLKINKKPSLETNVGRVLPSAILITPKDKTKGFLSTTDSNNFVNSAIYLTGGFTNGFGKLPTKISELLQIESNNGVEGRTITLTPQALIQGGYVNQLLIELDKFSKLPALKVEPQTINLSSSNNFMANIKVLSTNNEIVLLKTESSSSIIVSPSLFQIGENVSISRKEDSILGEFEVNILPVDASKSFIGAKLKVNVSDSSKPFLATNPNFGISLNTEEANNSQTVKVKVLSQDGVTELTSIPSTSQVTGTISDPLIANLGGAGISSVVGTLATEFKLNALKPGKANLNFTINSPDILAVSLPVEVSGTPIFSSTPIEGSSLANLPLSGVEAQQAIKLSSTSVSIDDIRLSSNSSIFPTYVPINFQSSFDGSNLVGLFTIRPIFGIDLFTAVPRTLVNKSATDFRKSLNLEITAIGGIVSKDESNKPVAILATSDGIRTIMYDQNVSVSLNESFNKISNISDVVDLKIFSFNDRTKIAAIKDSMLFLLDIEKGEVESSADLSSLGFELKLTMIGDQVAALVSVGQKGVDLITPITDPVPRIVNFKLPGNTKHITVVEKLDGKVGPFLIAYDGFHTLSIVDLQNINSQVQEIDTEALSLTKIDFAGRFTVNSKLTDLLIGTSERKVVLFDLNNLTTIPINDKLKIKNKIENLLVIDGIAYLGMGQDGILALSIGALVDSSERSAEVEHFKKNKLLVTKPNGSQVIISKSLNASVLAESKPFLLSSGVNNDLTVIKVVP